MPYSFGLIGYPLEHSLSPRIHAEFLRVCGLQGKYDLFPIPNDDHKEKELKRMIQRVKEGELNGINVTIPYKQNVLPYLDDLCGDAKMAGAVNTIYAINGNVFGENTDVEGFLLDVHNLIDLSEKEDALVFGAGGAARAVVAGLVKKGWKVTIAARQVHQASQLVQDIRASMEIEVSLKGLNIEFCSLNETGTIFQKLGERLQLVVNCTPVGMLGHANRSLFPEDIEIHDKLCVYDLVYNPRQTPLLKHVEKLGLRGRNGIGMLLEQARRSFEIWTGCAPSCPVEGIIQDLYEVYS